MKKQAGRRLFLGALLLLATGTPFGASDIHIEVREVTYSHGHASVELPIGSFELSPATLGSAAVSQEMAARILQAASRHYAEERAGLSLSLDHLLDDGLLWHLLVFEKQEGVQRFSVFGPGEFDVETLDAQKRYVIQPARPGYRCDLIVLSSQSGSLQQEIQCRASKPTSLVMRVVSRDDTVSENVLAELGTRLRGIDSAYGFAEILVYGDAGTAHEGLSPTHAAHHAGGEVRRTLVVELSSADR